MIVGVMNKNNAVSKLSRKSLSAANVVAPGMMKVTFLIIDYCSVQHSNFTRDVLNGGTSL